MTQINVGLTSQLNKLKNDKGYIHNDLCVEGNGINSLGKIKKIYGNLNLICNKTLKNLGELNYIKNDLWGRDSNFQSLVALRFWKGCLDST